ncbi:hypothetical protein GCM10008961_29360 [Deinococcus knuensis]|uniref:Uncharacterized protein n=1 Tax=Deinococcus knuensis TaxID=1837380 RepID=A0ABQ2SRN2_9DEIO|nr:hypothetical protein GCM10008961_29360 [Deinococcus knuensis]
MTGARGKPSEFARASGINRTRSTPGSGADTTSTSDSPHTRTSDPCPPAAATPPLSTANEENLMMLPSVARRECAQRVNG